MAYVTAEFLLEDAAKNIIQVEKKILTQLEKQRKKEAKKESNKQEELIPGECEDTEEEELRKAEKEAIEENKIERLRARIEMLGYNFEKYAKEFFILRLKGSVSEKDDLESLIAYKNKVLKILDTPETYDEDIHGTFIENLEIKTRAFSSKDSGSLAIARRFLGAVQYALPSSSYAAEEFCVDSGIEEFRDILINAVGSLKYERNILLSNFEYLKKLPKVKEAFSDPGNVRFYATYNENPDAVDLEQRRMLEKVAIGDASSYAIQNRTFDIIFHRFRYSLNYHNEYSGAIFDSWINNDIARLWRYARNDGVVIFMLPDFLLNTKNLLEIASKYRYLGGFSVEHEGFRPLDFQLVALVLQKKDIFELSDEKRKASYSALRGLGEFEPYQKQDIANIIKEALPKSDAVPVNFMRGSATDKLMLDIVIQDTTLFAPQETKKKRNPEPLLPFKKGQIGQVLASGKLDGIIDEGDGFKHVIRGRVFKGTKSKTKNDDASDGSVIQTTNTIISNSVEINLFAGDGTFKRIAVTV